MIGWVTRRIRRIPRRGTQVARVAVKKTRGAVARSLDRQVTLLDARWEEFFHRELGPRLTRWVQAGAPRPVLLSSCLVHLARDHEQRAELDRFVAACLERFDQGEVLRAASKAVRQLPPPPSRAQARLVRAVLRALDPHAAEEFGEHHIDIVWSDPAARRLLARREIQLGRIRRPFEILDPEDNEARALRRALAAEWKALGAGIPLSVPATRVAGDERRVIYFVAHSLPVQSVGYTIRTQSLVKPLRELGWDVEVFARLGYPADRPDAGELAGAPDLEVDGVPHHFRPSAGARELDLESYLAAAADQLVAQAEGFRPSAIHAASNFRVGLAGIEAARRLGLPSLYEMRGLWHYSRAAKEPRYQDSEHFRLSHALELQAARSADRVLVNGPLIRDLLVAAGVPGERIAVIPNGVDLDRFDALPAAYELRRQLGIDGHVVIGFIGSFFHFEGVDQLLRAAHLLRKSHGDTLRLLLVGDGPEETSLRDLAAELGLGDLVRFAGRVPHERVLEYYSVIDIAVYPRRGALVSELVPPLKPLEAMAARKPVVVSSAAALAGLVAPGETGLVFEKDDLDSLCRTIEQLIDSPGLREKLGVAARERLAGRSWTDSALAIADVYRALGLRLEREPAPRPRRA